MNKAAQFWGCSSSQPHCDTINQNPSKFHRDQKSKSKVYTGRQKTQNNQHNIKEDDDKVIWKNDQLKTEHKAMSIKTDKKKL